MVMSLEETAAQIPASTTPSESTTTASATEVLPTNGKSDFSITAKHTNDNPINGEEPPTKKQKTEEPTSTSETTTGNEPDKDMGVPDVVPVTMEPAPAPPTEPDMNNLPANPMPDHQKKHAITSIKAVRRLKDASPFLAPVDIVKLNIPFYYNFIKRPMDLSTIERKLNANAYETPEQVMDDFEVMVNNCFTFNGKDSAISQMVRNVQASFEKHMLNMPPKELPVKPVAPTSTKGRKKTVSSDVPKIRRENTADNGRPKREIHPPKPKDMPYDIRPKKKKFQAELRFCQQTIKELMSKKYDSISFPFLLPVDPVALDCPTYFDIVKEPMDLSTVSTKLQNGEYENGDMFERDVRLVFQNCYAFNPEGTAVNMMGHRLEAVFDEKWGDRPIAPPTPPSVSEDEEEDDEPQEFNVDINSITDPTIEFLVANIERMTQDLKNMRQEKYEQLKKEWMSKKKSKGRKGGKKGKKRSGSTSGLTNGSIYPTHVTYEMKKEISEAMADINEKMLKNVIAIIKEGIPDLADDEEIELDMDQLNNETLLKLYNYIVKPKNKPQRRRRKNTNNEEKKIENLKKKLQQFEQAEKPESSEDEDDDEEDESSEEE